MAPSGCHEWQGAKRGPMGYSSLGNEPGKLPRMVYGHIVSYRHHKGEIPPGMIVRHTCDNPICVNPEHLILGTHGDNVQDMLSKGRQGDRKPNKVSESQVREIRAMSESGLGVVPISNLYGISKSQVSKIARREAWRHVI